MQMFQQQKYFSCIFAQKNNAVAPVCNGVVFILNKFIGALIIVFSNILVFYKKGNVFRLNGDGFYEDYRQSLWNP